MKKYLPLNTDNTYIFKKILFALIMLYIIGSCIFFIIPDFTYNDSDAFWHIELGRWMIEHKEIPKTAIHTFYGDSTLPYIDHEVFFQLTTGFFYNSFGWAGVYTLNILCYFITLLGLFKLNEIAKLENKITNNNVLILFITLLFSEIMFLLYFRNRPQIMSTPIIIWFFIYLRQFQMKKSWSISFILIGLSLLLANVHGGVWLTIIVFFIMAIIESVFKKEFSLQIIITFIMVSLVGLLNFGGVKAITYILTTSGSKFTDWILEWNPIDFSHNYIFFITLLIFIFSSSKAMHKQNIFYFIFTIGILYLGVSNAKQHLYLLLFTPYFVTIAFKDKELKGKWSTYINMSTKKMIGSVFIGLLAALIIAINTPYKEPTKEYPVEEMNYILSNFKEGRPKVLAHYNISGYIMFSGGNILADGRFDPFITDETKDERGWTAIERSSYSFVSELQYVIKEDKPDYVILKHAENNKDDTETVVDILFKKSVESLGKPDFSGEYGDVWKVNK